MYLYKVASLSSILSVSLFVLIVKYFWAQNTAEEDWEGRTESCVMPTVTKTWLIIRVIMHLIWGWQKRTTYQISLFQRTFCKFWYFIKNFVHKIVGCEKTFCGVQYQASEIGLGVEMLTVGHKNAVKIVGNILVHCRWKFCLVFVPMIWKYEFLSVVSRFRMRHDFLAIFN